MKKLWIILLIISITGCQDAEQPELTENPTQDFTASIGGAISLQMRAVETTSPLSGDSASGLLIYDLIYDGLFELNEQMSPLAALATEYHFPTSGRLILNLREDVLWHDGKPFTAGDVIYSLKTIKQRPDSFHYSKLRNVSDFKQVDKHTVEISGTDLGYNFIRALTFPIIPSHTQELVGTGMYKLKSKDNQKILLERNADYNVNDAPYIEQVEVRLLDSDQAAQYAFLSNEINAVTTELIDFGEITINENITVAPFLTNRFEFLTFNKDNDLFSQKVRSAIAQAINREQIVQNAYFGYGGASWLPVNPKWDIGDLSGSPYDPELAAQLMFEAGYADFDGDGFLEREGDDKKAELEILVNDNNPKRIKAAEVVAGHLISIGIYATVLDVPWDTYVALIESKTYDAFLGGMEISDDLDLNGLLGITGGASPEVLSRAARATDRSELYSVFEEICNQLIEEKPFTGIAFLDGAIFCTSRIRNVGQITYPNNYKKIRQWTTE